MLSDRWLISSSSNSLARLVGIGLNLIDRQRCPAPSVASPLPSPSNDVNPRPSRGLVSMTQSPFFPEGRRLRATRQIVPRRTTEPSDSWRGYRAAAGSVRSSAELRAQVRCKVKTGGLIYSRPRKVPFPQRQKWITIPSPTPEPSATWGQDGPARRGADERIHPLTIRRTGTR